MADILIVAIGQPRFITKDYVKPGAIILDVGINNIEGKLVGDVDYVECQEVTEFISPVPGGIGPITTTMLLSNLVENWKNCILRRY